MTNLDSTRDNLVHHVRLAIERSGGTFDFGQQLLVETILNSLEEMIDEKVREMRERIRQDIENGLELRFFKP